jgi:hypothetical protein
MGGIKAIVAAIEKPFEKVFKSAEEVLAEKLAAGKRALEEIALHVDGAGLVVAEDTEAALELAVSALKREQAALQAKLAPPPVLVSSIAPSPSSLSFSMASPTPQAIAAAVSSTNASNPALNFASGNTAVATVDARGNVTPVAQGSTQIVIGAADGGGASATVSVSVGA